MREVTGSDSGESDIQMPEMKPSNMIPIEPDLYVLQEPQPQLQEEPHHSSHRSSNSSSESLRFPPTRVSANALNSPQ